jgi:hypothetical protein
MILKILLPKPTQPVKRDFVDGAGFPINGLPPFRDEIVLRKSDQETLTVIPRLLTMGDREGEKAKEQQHPFYCFHRHGGEDTWRSDFSDSVMMQGRPWQAADMERDSSALFPMCRAGKDGLLLP